MVVRAVEVVEAIEVLVDEDDRVAHLLQDDTVRVVQIRALKRNKVNETQEHEKKMKRRE